jgi:hypothetical protein
MATHAVPKRRPAMNGLYGDRPRALDATQPRSDGSPQRLTVTLEGITAGDYLCWVYDPEPRALGRELRSITVTADPLDDRITAELCWEHEPLEPCSAAVAAGFVLSPEVVRVVAEDADRVGQRPAARLSSVRRGGVA